MAGACSPLDPASCVASVVGDGIAQMAQTFADGASWAVKNMVTLWLKTPAPDVDGAGSASVWLSSSMAYFVLAATFASILWAAYRMATSGTFDHLADLGAALARLVVVSGCVGAATTAALAIGESVSGWVLAQAPARFSPVVMLGTSSPAVVILLSVT